MSRLKQPRKPHYSIVIPAFNEEMLLGDCLQSLATQKTNIAYEVVVVDNNSTDNTAKIARQHGARVVKESNPGVCWARQAGLEAARGEIVISTDADTTYHPNWLNTIDAHMQKPGVIAVGGPVTYTGDIWWANAWSNTLFGFSAAWKRVFGQPGYVSACNLAYRKNAVEKYDTNLTQGGDELAILKQLKQHGDVLLDRTNTVYTSGRRQSRGFLYTFFVTFLVYYLLGYALSRMMNRTVFGSYPAFRDIRKHTQTPAFQKVFQRASMFAALTVLVLLFHVHPTKAARFIQQAPRHVTTYFHDKD